MPSILKLQYADDAVIAAHTPEMLQRLINIIYQTYNRLGLKMNTDKNEVLCGKSRGHGQETTSINVGPAQLKNVQDLNTAATSLMAVHSTKR